MSPRIGIARAPFESCVFYTSAITERWQPVEVACGYVIAVRLRHEPASFCRLLRQIVTALDA